MKKLVGLIAVAAFILTGCSQELKVTTAENVTTEYGDKLDNNKLFNAKESDENVKVKEVKNFDEKKVGEQTLKVTFTDGDKDTEKEIKVKVEDTKKPEIELKKDKVAITAGDKLELKDNVKSVKDPVDGDLKYSDKKVEKDGYYIDQGKLDTKKDGTYDVKIIAVDKNGNKSEKTFKVVVEKKKETKKEDNNTASNNNSSSNNNGGNVATGNNNTQQPSSPAPSGGNSGSTGGSSSNGNSGNGGTTAPPAEKPQEPVTCTLPKPGDDGKVYNSQQEAWDAGWTAVTTEGNPFYMNAYSVVGTYDNCDNIYYVLVFRE